MATAPMLAHERRKKPATYGKTSRRTNNAWDASNLDTFDEYDVGSQFSNQKSTTAPRTYTSATSESKPRKLKPVKARPEKQEDSWDVSSSDDGRLSPIRQTSPPKPATRQKPSFHSEEPETPLAPWEKRKKQESAVKVRNSASKRRRNRSDASDTHVGLNAKSVRIEEEETQQTPKASAKSSNLRDLDSRASTVSNSPPVQSAAARLYAKRSQAAMKTAPHTDDASLSSRKRMRTGSDVDERDTDVVMRDALAMPSCGETPSRRQDHDNDAADSHDIAESSLGRGLTHEEKTPRPLPNSRKVTLSQATPYWTTGENSLASEPDSPEAASRSPSARGSVVSTPKPDAGSESRRIRIQATRASSPGSAGEGLAAITPKQANLWKQLLSADESGPSPSVLPMHQLNIHSDKRPAQAAPSASNSTSRPKTYLGRRRARLVDRLKASAPESEDDTTGKSDSEPEQSAHEHVLPDRHEMEDIPASSQQSHSQSQPTRAPDSGPKITYARDRSYLREESFEEGLMFELATETPQKAELASSRRANNSKQSSQQKSAFDMDDSDDEDSGAGRMRTVHELRAGGGNQRFMDDIGGLLDDIADHNMSARGRRRAALMEIAAKLTDRAYAEKFVRQGFEQALVKECGSTPDEIADFTTTAALVTLMANDLPDHAVQALRDSNYLPCLLRLLSITTDVRKLTRDRRYNMSKAAQSSFAEFVQRLAERQVTWGETKVSYITPRLLALKALEQVIQKLRRTGDRSELVAASDVEQIWPAQVDEQATTATTTTATVTLSTEDALAVSVLESLSTSTQALAWPVELVQRLGMLLTAASTAAGDRGSNSSIDSGDNADTRHTLFLTLRLCLNLTNENVRNCRALATPATVLALLQAIRKGFSGLAVAKEDKEEATAHEPKEDEEDGEVEKQPSQPSSPPQALKLDILVLSMGILMNLAEHDDAACAAARASNDARELLGELVAVCQHGQKRALDAESEEESAFNVAYGYLAVTLAQLCRDADARAVIASRLPAQHLGPLVAAVEEFVAYHKDVDRLGAAPDGGSGIGDSDEGMEVWSAFTEKLQGVLVRLKSEMSDSNSGMMDA